MDIQNDIAHSTGNPPLESEDKEQSREFLTITVAGQNFGIPILDVQDVLGEQVINPIPLAPHDVAGSLNLRGRIVTALHVRKCLGLERDGTQHKNMNVVVEHQNELYSLIVDDVGDVMRLKNEDFKPTPGTLDPVWRELSSGVYQLKDELLVVLDVPKFLETVHN